MNKAARMMLLASRSNGNGRGGDGRSYNEYEGGNQYTYNEYPEMRGGRGNGGNQGGGNNRGGEGSRGGRGGQDGRGGSRNEMEYGGNGAEMRYDGGNYDGSRGGQGRDGRGTMEYNYPPSDNYDRDRQNNGGQNMWYDPFRHGGVRYDGRYPEIENAFYDRRGRRHYDDGRYAPQSMYNDGYPYYPPVMPQYNNGGDYKRTRMGFNQGYDFEMDGRAGDMMGYAKGRIMPSKMRHGNMMQEEPEELDEKTAKKWVKSMENSDGTKGEHFTKEQVEKLAEKLGIECDPMELWVAANAMYSDFAEVFKELGVAKDEAYVKMAEAFIDDEDAVPDKLAAYYKYVVEH